ncbi:hypothetical protein, partial [Microcystis sp. M53602_WE12]|uniref:hypothetical protein n=1 Tax=Microcystis sp. M53602_WE12 TaxID=3030674 RepID=UPI00258C76F3
MSTCVLSPAPNQETGDRRLRDRGQETGDSETGDSFFLPTPHTPHPTPHTPLPHLPTSPHPTPHT